MDGCTAQIVDTRKLCLLGDRKVGKTSILDRYVRGAWPRPHFRSASLKVDGRVIRTSQGQSRRLLLWDIARAVLPGNGCSSYLQGAQGFVLVADGTRAGTVQYAIGQWQSAKDALGADIPAVMLINKHDLLDKWALSARVIEKVARYLPTYITSARTGESIDAAFASIGERATPGPRLIAQAALQQDVAQVL